MAGKANPATFILLRLFSDLLFSNINFGIISVKFHQKPIDHSGEI